VSRGSVLAIHAAGAVQADMPLRGYFLSVGGALLVFLSAAGWLLPAPPPSPFASEVALPPIRIHSDMKRPEPVVIDTTQPPPAPEEIVTASPHVRGLDSTDAAQAPTVITKDGETHLLASTASQQREIPAPVVRDRALGGPHGSAASEPRRQLAHVQSSKQRRSPRHARPGARSRCEASSAIFCRYAFTSQHEPEDRLF
jgi:hypothetical protein